MGIKIGIETLGSFLHSKLESSQQQQKKRKICVLCPSLKKVKASKYTIILKNNRDALNLPSWIYSAIICHYNHYLLHVQKMPVLRISKQNKILT